MRIAQDLLRYRVPNGDLAAIASGCKPRTPAATKPVETRHVPAAIACTHTHAADAMRLLCRAHNQHFAELVYGRAKMEACRAAKVVSTQPRLL